MEGREPKLNNDLFFVCVIIEQIARMTKNHRIDVIRAIGDEKLAHILDFADVYHCEALENTANDLINECNISTNDFDNVAECKYKVPYIMDIARVYMRLALAATEIQGFSPIAALFAVYASPICAKIDDYNCSMYYENPQYQYLSYVNGSPLMD